MPRKSKAADPLEGVRISDPAGDDAPEIVSEEAEISPAPPPPRKPKPGKKEEPKVPPPEPANVAPRYKVLAMKRLSFQGQMITLKLGKVVSDDTHGPGFIDMLKKAEVPLEPAD